MTSASSVPPLSDWQCGVPWLIWSCVVVAQVSAVVAVAGDHAMAAAAAEQDPRQQRGPPRGTPLCLLRLASKRVWFSS